MSAAGFRGPYLAFWWSRSVRCGSEDPGSFDFDLDLLPDLDFRMETEPEIDFDLGIDELVGC